MSALWPIILGGSQSPLKGLPTWNLIPIQPTIVNEGEPMSIVLSGSNLVPGNRIVMWFTDPLAPTGNWVEDWWLVVQREIESKVGITARKLALKAGSPPGVGTLDILFTVTDEYRQGMTYTFTNATRRNRADNQQVKIPGETGYGRDVQILLRVIPTDDGGVPAQDGVRGKAGSYFYARDTSRAPLGTPSINVSHRGANGGQFAVNVQEGESFQTVITGYNVAPNTVIKMYHANEGQNDVKPGLRDQLVSACAAAGCIGTVPSWTPATALQWFNGGYIRFPKTYVSGTPIVLNYLHPRDNNEEPIKQMDVLTNIYCEGDVDDLGGLAYYAGNWDAATTYKQKDWVYYLPTGRRFVCTAAIGAKGTAPPTDDGDTYENNFWREYVPVVLQGTSTSRMLVDIPARYWELRATTDGTTITYTIQGPHASDSSVALVSTNAPPGFDAALQNALSASGFMSLANGRLWSTNPTQAEGAVSFTVPHAGTGKHVLRLTDLQGQFNSYIIIGDACVYLTPPPAIDTTRNLYGWNAAGGEFNVLYTPNYTTEKPASTWGNGLPGKPMVYNGGRYYYPSKPEEPDPANQHQQMDYFHRMGARYMRLPFKMQRLQREAYGPLYYGDDGPITKFSSHDMRRVIELSSYWLNLDPQNRIMFDAHGFGSYTYDVTIDENGVATTYSDRFKFNSPYAPPSILVDFWVKFVQTMLVALPMGRWDVDFMNEPIEVNSAIAPYQWAAIMQWLTNAVRARTDYLGIVHREGTEYTSAQNWAANGNGTANLNSYDPAKNMLFHVHTYNDKDASGVSGTCVPNAGKARLIAVTNWARENGFTRANGAGLFLGETGAGSPAVAGQEICGQLINDQLQFILDNSDVWMGYTWYASGFGVSYPFSLDPSNGSFLNPTHTVNLLMNSGFWKRGNGIT
ncbi:cellulase family glycosylhydrolase [Sphingomonas sp. CFBP 13714]|uniref:cellulase family glycosylhydrolase n=1 Tax=Sphingomonas sp. CFBP 13714 TaxID=2775308 RepID=UPI001784EF05|nr:cellulase family glycosylhydrolase [Sphingomonas sp. CFBP 13714]MBD8699269.1 cellulase family glycosylhydrolase [Sphingomonas sp. CFBP 13714]